jgi:hypothetical protein
MAAFANRPAHIMKLGKVRPKANAELFAHVMREFLGVNQELKQGHSAGRLTQGHHALLPLDLVGTARAT